MTPDATVLLDPEAEERATVAVQATFGGRWKREGELRRLVAWLPMAAALYMVASTASAGPTLYDSGVYLEQAEDIARWDVPSGRYPPGFPVVLAVGGKMGLAAGDVVHLTAVALVVLVVVAARRIAGPVAGAVAGVLCCVSPWLVASSSYVMSDPLAAVIAVVGLLAVVARRPMWAAVAAVLGVLVRLFSVVGVVALLPVGRRYVATALVAALILFGTFQWAASGSPLSTGYSSDAASWAPGFVVDNDRTGDGSWIVAGEWAKSLTPATSHRGTPNVASYPIAVFGFVFVPPLTAGFGLWALWRRRSTDAARYVGWWLVGSLVVVLPYFFQSPRLIAPAMMLLTVYTAVGIADLLRATRRGRRPRGIRWWTPR